MSVAWLFLRPSRICTLGLGTAGTALVLLFLLCIFLLVVIKIGLIARTFKLILNIVSEDSFLENNLTNYGLI